MTFSAKSVKINAPIVIICLVGLVLRLWGLTYQSLWLDELHTMNEADPANSWGELFGFLKTSEHHPPLFFILERVFFNLFGHTAFAARFLSAIAGVAGIWAIYRLGKEILNKELGIFCSMLACINFFCISYAQEARPYALAFLLVTFSFTYFVKLIKSPGKKNALWYSASTILLMYTHYYSLFVLGAQFLFALFFLFQQTETNERRIFLKFHGISFLAIILAYLPWLGYFKTNLSLRSFWIPDVPSTFFQDYFFGYFGNSELLKPLLLLLVFFFFIRAALNATAFKFKDDTLSFTAVLAIFWIFIVVLIPYIYSQLTVPMLYPRYTIVILPAVLLVLGFSITEFKTTALKYSVLVLFIVLSLSNLFFTKKYYQSVSKTQFREMTQYVVKANTSNFPIINEHTSWQQGYYLKLFNSDAPVFNDKKEIVVDSILHRTSEKYDLDGFWLVGAHGDVMPDSLYFNGLDTAYDLIEKRTFNDAWAQFYASKNPRSGGYFKFLFRDFVDGEKINDQKQIAIWNGSINTRPINLKRGDYSLTIKAWGTAAAGIFPHLNLYINNKKIGEYFVTGNAEEKQIQFQLAESASGPLRVEMDNDMTVPEKREDRNAFVESVLIKIH